MVKVDLLKEINENSQETSRGDQILVDQVKGLLESKSQREREVLELTGLNHHLSIAQNIKGEAIERKKFFEKYDTFLTRDQLAKLCYKYGLRCLKTSYFKGNIGPNVAANIDRFVEKHSLQAELRSGNFKSCLYIMAPSSAFELENRPVPPDPILFYNPNEHNREPNIYIPIDKWGNDFTVFRMIKGWIGSKTINLFITISLFVGLIIGLSFLSLFGFILASGIAFIILSIICAAGSDSITDWINNFNKPVYDCFSHYKD